MKALLPLVFATALPAIEPTTTLEPGAGETPSFDLLSYIDATTAQAVYSPGMDFDNGNGELDQLRLGLRSFLSQPVRFGGDWYFVPYFRYNYQDLDVGTRPAPLDDYGSDLHQFALDLAVVRFDADSPWIYGAFVEPALFSDLSAVGSDDFFLAGAVALGYRFNDCFTLGVGLYGNDLTRDPFIIGGPGFVWTPTPDWLITYYGPRFLARREFGDATRLGFELSTNGGQWNTETGPISTKLELRSWRAGLYWRQRLGEGPVWLTLSAGYTFANEIELSTPGGTELFQNNTGELDGAPYVALGISVNRW